MSAVKNSTYIILAVDMERGEAVKETADGYATYITAHADNFAGILLQGGAAGDRVSLARAGDRCLAKCNATLTRGTHSLLQCDATAGTGLFEPAVAGTGKPTVQWLPFASINCAGTDGAPELVEVVILGDVPIYDIPAV